MNIPFIGNNWYDPASTGRIEIVFNNRKSEFGAYLLRKEYAATVSISLSIVSLITAGIIAWDIFLNRSGIKQDPLIIPEEIILTEPPSIDKTVPPLPPVVIPPPVRFTVIFSPPIVVRDEEVEELPSTVEEFQNAPTIALASNGNISEALPPQDPITAPEETDEVFTLVEEMPSFPGGENEMISFIHSNIKYPDVARENNIHGKVFIRFTVDKEGNILNPEIIRGIGAGCDEEAMRVLKLMPRWNPGKQNGKKVKVGSMVLHIDFILR